MARANNLICLHYGDLYGPEYVLNMWRGATRATARDFTFYVYTDNPDQHPQDLGWHFLPLPDWNIARPWWFKLALFGADLPGQNLYLDLDTVIVGSIDKFWDYKPDTFRICQDFNRAMSSHIRFTNSSVMAWPDRSQLALYELFKDNAQLWQREFRGDQDFIHAHAEEETWWPTEWAQSWKWEVKDLSNLQPDTSIIVCHGKPDVHEVPALREIWDK